LNADFLRMYRALPENIRDQARKNYRLWKADPGHPSLHFKRVGQRMEVYSVRVSQGWRALGLRTGDTVIWFWIGSHAEYDQILKNL
jgi:hypothetical protein